MDKESAEDVAALGAAIGRRLADARSSATSPMVALRMFVDAVLTQHPMVKLPELSGDEEVKRWLGERSLGAGQLRNALTEARRVTREKSVVKRPPRRARSRTSEASEASETPASRPPSAKSLETGIVRNRPLADI